MKSLRRPLLVAAVFCAVLRGAAAEAQTIILRHVPEGVTFDASLVASAAVAATTDPYGNAVIAINSLTRGSEMVARIYVVNCGTGGHVVLADRNAPVPAIEPGCGLRELSGAFVVRRNTTLVVNLGETPPAVRIAQGRAPENWLQDVVAGAGLPPADAPYRLGVFAGGGLSIFRGLSVDACGDSSACRTSNVTQGGTAGVSFWLSPWLGAEISYAKDVRLTASGEPAAGTSFTTETDPEMIMLAGKVGRVVNRVGLYAKGGATFHRATTTETDVLPNITRTVSGIVTVFPGGTLATAYRTQGWGWLAGAGMDIRVTNRFGIYLDGRLAKLSGTASGSPAVRNTLTPSLQMGLRFALVP